MARPRTVYRGKRKYGWIITLVVSLVVVAILGTVGLFFYLQQFIVYDKDSLHIQMPYMGTQPPRTDEPDIPGPAVPSVPADIVVDMKDYSDVVTSAGADLPSLKAKYLGADKVSAANKVKGIRAALCGDCYSAEYTRRHNDANILTMGARVTGGGLACKIVDTFLSTDFEGGRHAKRVALISELEERERA